MRHQPQLESLTPAQRAAILDRLRTAPRHRQTSIQPALEARRPLSFGQEQIWIFQQIHRDSAAYHLPARFRVTGNLNVDALGRAFRKVLQRHEALRTVVRSEGLDQWADLLDPSAFRIPYRDLRELPEALRGIQVDDMIRQENRRPFDLTADFPIRYMVLRTGGYEHEIALTLHHIAADGWSIGILMAELTACYSQNPGEPDILPALPIQYSDYAAWTRKRAQQTSVEMDWWNDQMTGARRLRLPITSGAQPTHAARHSATSLGPRLTQDLRRFCRERRFTPFMLLLASYQFVISRYTGQTEFVVGAPTANRTRPELEGLIGYFINLLPLRARVRPELPAAEFLDQTREMVLEVNSRQGIGLERLGETLTGPDSPLPLQATLTVHNNPAPPSEFAGLRITPVAMAEYATRFDIEMHVAEQADDFQLTVYYRRDLFGDGSLAGLPRHTAGVLAALISGGSTPLGAMPLLHGEEAAAVQRWSHVTTPGAHSESVGELVAAQAARRPDALAICSGVGRITYSELHLGALRLASHLRVLGIGLETRVGLVMERSPELITTLLGIIYAGAAYTVIDPVWPAEMSSRLIAQAAVSCLITNSSFVDRLPAFWGPVFNLDTDCETLPEPPQLEAPIAVPPDALCYISFTSGSTGVRKAVGVVHRAVLALVRGNRYASFDETGVFLQFAPVSFDASTFEIWGALLNGATLAVAPPGPLSLTELGSCIRKLGVTTVWLTAGLFQQAADSDLSCFAGVQDLLTGGDRVSPAAAKTFLAAFPSLRLTNGYGPTETTTFACTHLIRTEDTAARSVPIGVPIAGTTVYIVDRYFHFCPPGIAGELWIGGAGVARGYLNAPAETAERFVPDDFGGTAGARLYRSGDIVRRLPSGVIEFIGRADSEVKVRGFRVDPNETNTALRALPGVEDAIVVALDPGIGEMQLWAYVVVQGESVTAETLTRSLAASLPAQLIPAGYVFLPSIPLTANGKPDLRALPPPRFESAARFGVPRDIVEFRLARIWEEVLDRHAISLFDDFFAIGGSSLSAVRVIARIEACFGVKLPLVEMFRSPTIEQLGERVRDRRVSGQSSCLVDLQPRGSLRPLFLVHPAGGNILCFTDLIRELDQQRPILAFQSRGLDQTDEPFHTIPEMARHYVDLMRQRQPVGPYLIAGLSMGGMVAYEMACLLEQESAQVSFLGIIDSGPLPDSEKLRIQGVSAEELMLWRVRNWNPEVAERCGDTEPSRLLERVLELAREAGLLLPDVDLPGLMHLLRIYQVNAMAHVNYQPRRSQVPMTLFRAAESIADAPDLGWYTLALGGIETIVVPGRHETLIGPEFARAFAHQLQSRLSAADACFA